MIIATTCNDIWKKEAKKDLSWYFTTDSTIDLRFSIIVNCYVDRKDNVDTVEFSSDLLSKDNKNFRKSWDYDGDDKELDEIREELEAIRDSEWTKVSPSTMVFEDVESSVLNNLETIYSYFGTLAASAGAVFEGGDGPVVLMYGKRLGLVEINPITMLSKNINKYVKYGIPPTFKTMKLQSFLKDVTVEDLIAVFGERIKQVIGAYYDN